MPKRDIIVVGASAGGVETLMQLVRGLPRNLDAAIFVVLHLPASSPSVLPHILSRNGPIPARHPVSGEPPRAGNIYVAPPNKHLILESDAILLSSGPKENGHRPSIDVLFRSAAVNYGPRVTGVVLSGSQSDGSAGLRTIRTRGGLAVVQDPEEALYPSMPRHAIESGPADFIVPVAEIARVLAQIAGLSSGAAGGADPDSELELRIAEGAGGAVQDSEHPGEPSVYACPDCHGVLWEVQEGEVLRFRCRVGHAWNAEDLLTRQQDSIEDAMWMAVRALEEKASLASRMAQRLQVRHEGAVHGRFQDQAREALWQAELIRRALDGDRHKSLGDDGPDMTK